MKSNKNDLSVLKAELKKAIKECDFARAKALDAHIKSLSKQKSDSEYEKKMLTSKLKFNITRESIGKEIIQTQMKANQTETETINAFQKRLLTLRAKHQRENQDLDDKLAIELEKANTRPVPEAENVKLYAQKQANLGNFDVAEASMYEYEQIRSRVVQQRIDDLINKFQQDKIVMTTRQEAQIAHCNEKLQNAIKAIRSNLQAEVNRKNGELNSVSLKLGLGPLTEENQIKTVQIMTENVDLNQTSLASTGKSPRNKSLSKALKSPMRTPK